MGAALPRKEPPSFMAGSSQVYVAGGFMGTPSLPDFLIKWALAALAVTGGVLLMQHLGYIIKI